MKSYVKHALLAPLALSGIILGCSGEPDSNPAPQEVQKVDSPTPYPVEDAERDQLAERYAALRTELIEMEAKLIAPSIQDYDAHADFLTLPNSGLARLYPRGRNPKSSLVVWSGNGNYFSFVRNTNDWGDGNDLSFESWDGEPFEFGVVLTGFIGDLGKVDIRSVTESDPSVVVATNYDIPEERAQREELRLGLFNSGFSQNGVTFKSRIQAFVGNTYVIRSYNDSTSDSVSVFQLIRRDKDGSIVIAWKRLSYTDLTKRQ